MINALTALLPPGSLFSRTGSNIRALLTAVSWQFQQAKDLYNNNVRQTDPLTAKNLDVLAKEYNIDISQLDEKQSRALLNFCKNNPLDMTKGNFYEAFKIRFPRVDIIATPAGVTAYEYGQTGTFTIGSSQCSGYIRAATGGDVVFVKGIVESYQQMRFLRWFLERFDRAKHKHEFAILIEQTVGTAMTGTAQAGAMIIGGYSGGPI